MVSQASLESMGVVEGMEQRTKGESSRDGPAFKGWEGW